MIKVWYENPKVLFNNLNEFFPNKKLSKIQNINSIARFTIYFSILILIFKLDNRWLIISIYLLLFSYYLNIIISTDENFKNINNKSTFDNPYMNYNINNENTFSNTPLNTFSNLLPNTININDDISTNLNNFINNKEIIEKNKENFKNINTINYDLCITSDSNKSCTPNNKIEYDIYNLPNKFKINDKLKKEIRKNYRSHLKFDSLDMWGKFINDRNYYTLSNIDSINDQTGFAEWCYTNNGKSGECKINGSDCLKDRNVKNNIGRIIYNT